MPWHDALLISDYGKGVCTPRLLRAAIEAANRARHSGDRRPEPACPLEHYRGVTLIKPNRVETELATGSQDRQAGRRPGGRPTTVRDAGRQAWRWSRSIATA